jgi:hypothetical protein
MVHSDRGFQRQARKQKQPANVQLRPHRTLQQHSRLARAPVAHTPFMKWRMPRQALGCDSLSSRQRRTPEPDGAASYYKRSWFDSSPCSAGVLGPTLAGGPGQLDPLCVRDAGHNDDALLNLRLDYLHCSAWQDAEGRWGTG